MGKSVPNDIVISNRNNTLSTIHNHGDIFKCLSDYNVTHPFWKKITCYDADGKFKIMRDDV